MKIISQKLNITFSYQSTSDGNLWGWVMENGSWTGLKGDLKEGRADVGVAGMYLMQTTLGSVDISTPYKIEYFSFITPIPGVYSQWNALLLPFSGNLMALTAGFTIFGMFAIIILVRIQNDSKIHETNWFTRPSSTVLTLFSCVLSNVWMHLPKSTHMRILMTVWSLGFFLVGSSYNGSLLSFLTVPIRKRPINTHKELYEEGVAVGAIGPEYYRKFKKATDPWLRKLSERYKNVYTTDEALDLTAKGNINLIQKYD